ncbi:MAG: PadR family transcriptional regulator [Gammaproteobacteria bacterium]|nr:PadR family transcriptional regulator [Gammaproteobacteria bacterium]
MSLKHAVLIALEENEGSGYEITKWFEDGPGHFWFATHQQIYRELAKMTDDGWVSFNEVQQQGKPAKKMYQLTTQGRNALVEWLLEPGSPSPLKDTLLMKIYSGHLVSPKHLLEELLRVKHANEETLSRYHQIEEELYTTENRKVECVQFAHLTLRNGIIMLTAWLMWADEVIQFLNKKIKPY